MPGRLINNLLEEQLDQRETSRINAIKYVKSMWTWRPRSRHAKDFRRAKGEETAKIQSSVETMQKSAYLVLIKS